MNNFPQKCWMNNSIEYSGLYWMNIFLNEYSGFCFELNILNWIIFRPDWMKKWIYKTDRPPLEECAISILRTCAEEKYDRWSVWLSPSITSKGSCWHSRGNELCFHSWVFKSHQAPHCVYINLSLYAMFSAQPQNEPP